MTGLAFDPLDEEAGIVITDPIERCRYALYTPTAVRPVPADPDQFRVPIDDAVTVTTDRISLRQIAHAYVRDERGEMVAELRPGTERAVPAGTYDIELNAPIKVYLRVDGPVTAIASIDRMAFEFGAEAEVVIGARSYHQHPAETLVTTRDPEDMMTAISLLGSALKTTTCERSYPTLRGHPPLIELGDRLDIPTGVTKPSTGIRLELPPAYRTVFVAAPLAYYLDADIVRGSEPRLVTDTGFEHRLDGARGFEAEVERVLKQVFFLDCLTRTEGHYRVDLHERAVVEPLVDLDFAQLYDRPLACQLEAYLSIPFETIEDHLPTWGLTAHVPPEPEHVEVLPFVVNEFGIIRTADAQPLSESEVRSAVLEGYLDDGTGKSRRSGGRAALRTADPSEDVPALVAVQSTGAIEEAWFGEAAPLRGTKASEVAFRHALKRAPKNGPIDVVVVCNGTGRDEASDVVDAVYGSRDELPFDVTLHRDLSTAALRRVLESRTDFLHYIGHIDADGFRCTDGVLDVATFDAVGVDAFLLNGCRSYEQGTRLIDAGSVGGVVTIADVVDNGAVEIGCAMARLLNLGFRLRDALMVARDESVIGGHYLVIGNGNVAIAQIENGVPLVCVVEPIADDDYQLTLRAFLPMEGGMGTTVYPTLETNDQHFLAPSEIGPFALSGSALRGYLSRHRFPIEIGGERVWNEPADPIGDVR